MGITETWLHVEGSELTIGELCPNGYRLLHSPRLAGRGGSVGLLYKQGIGSKTRLSFRSFECIDVTFVACKSLRAIVVYRPPGGAWNFLDSKTRLTLRVHHAFLCTLLCCHCTTSTWKCLISRFVQDVNTKTTTSSFF